MKQLDFDRAFPQTPDCIHAAIEMGFRKGKKQMKMRNKMIAIGSIAAALMIMLAATLASGGLSIAPKPDVLVQPEITDIPKTTEEPMVWCTEKGNYYHSEEHCSGMEGAIYETLSYALALDKGSCPVCITGITPVLIPTTVPAPEPTELPLNSDDQDFFEENPLDYLTEKGIYQHYDSDCCGITGAKPYTYEDAKAFNRLSCPVCAVAREIVYYTDNGKYYHVVEDCSGMQNARVHQAAEAPWDNKTPCPVCVVPYVYEIEMGKRERTEEEMKRFYPFEGVDLRLGDTVYTELSEKYFHIVEGCSDSPTIETTQLDSAVGRNQLPCPVCVLDEKDNYELFKNTFGKEPYEVREKRNGFGFFPQPEKAATCWHFGEFGNVSPTMVFYDIHPDYNTERQLKISFSEDESKDFFESIEVHPIKDMYAKAIEAVQEQLREAGDSTSTAWVKEIRIYYDDALQIKVCNMSFFFEHNTDLLVRFDVLENGSWDMSITPNESGATVYAPYGQARYYHKTDVCNGQQNKRELSLSEAEKERLSPCPDCYVITLSEKNAAAADVILYYTPNGKYYHSDADCDGMQNAESHSRRDAYTSGKLPCPTCLLVYCNEDGLYFHLLPDCMGMQFSDLHTLTDAYTMNNLRCPLCLSPSTVYATKTGKYFHAEEHCSSMTNASVSTPETEWQNGKTPCYVCITGDSTRTLTGDDNILSETEAQSEASVRLPEHHELFENAFGKSINTLFPGCNFSFESWDVNDENANNRVWMLKNSADPNEEVFAGVIEYAPGNGDYDGYHLRVNLTDNLTGAKHANNAQEFLKDAYFWKNGIQVSLRNLCDYTGLFGFDEMKKLKGEESRFSVEGVQVFFDENKNVCRYAVRYRYDGKDAYILSTTIDEDGKLWWDLLEGK